MEVVLDVLSWLSIVVGLFFMHLQWEKPWIRWIALMPASMGIFAVLLMCEQVFRGNVM